MTRRHVAALLAVAALWLPSGPAAAGPWVPSPGDGYLSLGFTHFRAATGMRDGVSTGLAYRTSTWRLYSELGLPGRLVLTVSLPYVQAVNRSGTTPVSYHHDAFGDLRFALDHAPLRSLPFTFGVEVKVPAYSDPSEHDSADGIDDRLFDPMRFPVIGDDSIDVTPRLQIGHSFHPAPVWAQASLGYQWRGCRRHIDPCEDLRDGILISGGVGAWIWADHLATELYTKAVFSVQPAAPDTVPTEQSLYVQGKLTGTAPALRGLGVTLGVGGLPYASAAARGWDVSAGLAWKF